ncbi:MAG: biopolymer transporter ExbD [Candidatus Omnitrophica bacterium]|nr:biopolymer transporter ExbD [Candidatus Omnitrophota bacterium]
MIKFRISEYAKQRPGIQMTSMVDIMFINLLFFMALFVYFHFETELNISVPKAAASAESPVSPEEITINITQEGRMVVNQKELTADALTDLLQKTARLYPGQAVILRADEKTYHEHVVRALDSCAKAKIWNISFATTKENA